MLTNLRTSFQGLDADAPEFHSAANGLNNIPSNYNIGPKRATESIGFGIKRRLGIDLQQA